MLLCVGCAFGVMWGMDARWPWWSFVLLGFGVVVFFFAGPVDDD